MKQNVLLKKDIAEENCSKQPCIACQSCKIISFDEKRREVNNISFQLYAKESENYAFYYALSMAQK